MEELDKILDKIKGDYLGEPTRKLDPSAELKCAFSSGSKSNPYSSAHFFQSLAKAAHSLESVTKNSNSKPKLQEFDNTFSTKTLERIVHNEEFSRLKSTNAAESINGDIFECKRPRDNSDYMKRNGFDELNDRIDEDPQFLEIDNFVMDQSPKDKRQLRQKKRSTFYPIQPG